MFGSSEPTPLLPALRVRYGEARRKEAVIKAACPPGHRMLPEEERAETLALVTSSLEAAKKEVRGCCCRRARPSGTTHTHLTAHPPTRTTTN